MEKNVVEVFGCALRELRSERGLSQQTLADISGVERKFLGMVELGRKQPTLVTMTRLALGLAFATSNPALEKAVVEAFGRTVVGLRSERSLTQEKLGFLAGMQRKHLGAIELGRKQPTLRSMVKLSEGLDLPLLELLQRMTIELEVSAFPRPKLFPE